MEIALVSADLSPLTGDSEAGAFARSLGRELVGLGHRVVVFVPYRAHLPGFGGLTARPIGEPVEVTLGGTTRAFEVLDVETSDPTLQCRAVRNDALFDRASFVLDPATGLPWPDNAERIGFFTQAICGALVRMNWVPDLLHGIDLPSAVLPICLREQRGLAAAFSRIATVYTVQDLREQGIFPRSAMEWVPLDLAFAHPLGPLEFFEQINLVKAALLYADEITAPSPRLAQAMLTEAKSGRGLQGVFASRATRLTGILSGIDTEIWNPATDPLLPYTYSLRSFQGKLSNKIRLLEALELPVEPDVPLFVMWGPLADDRGFALFETLGGDLLGHRLKWVVLGGGDAAREARMRRLRERLPERFAFSREVDAPLRHLAFAGADVSVSIDLESPSGKTEMRAHRYATLPLAYAAGGVLDVVRDHVSDSGRGNGFLLQDYTPEALHEAVVRAVAAYERRRSWKKLSTQLLEKDYSWARVARDYERVYRRALEARRPTDAPS